MNNALIIAVAIIAFAGGITLLWYISKKTNSRCIPMILVMLVIVLYLSGFGFGIWNQWFKPATPVNQTCQSFTDNLSPIYINGGGSGLSYYKEDGVTYYHTWINSTWFDNITGCGGGGSGDSFWSLDSDNVVGLGRP